MKRASRPCWRFRRRARAAMVEIGSAGVSSMNSGQFSRSRAAWMKRRISSSVMSPWRILVRGDAGGLGEHAGGELLGRHLEREEADDAAVDGAFAAVGPGALLVGAGDVEGDVGGERGLAHRRAAGEDQEVGGVQAAEALVEVGEAGREAGEAAVALVGGVGDLDRVDDGAAEGLEAACRSCPARRAGRAPARPRRSGPWARCRARRGRPSRRWSGRGTISSRRIARS